MTVYTRCYLSCNQNHVRFVEPYMLCDLSVVANRTILVVEELLTTFSDALFPFYEVCNVAHSLCYKHSKHSSVKFVVTSFRRCALKE